MHYVLFVVFLLFIFFLVARSLSCLYVCVCVYQYQSKQPKQYHKKNRKKNTDIQTATKKSYLYKSHTHTHTYYTMMTRQSIINLDSFFFFWPQTKPPANAICNCCWKSRTRMNTHIQTKYLATRKKTPI